MINDSVVYKAAITITVVENGFVIKNGSPQSQISNFWVARTKDELVKVVSEIAEKYDFSFKKAAP